MIAAVSSIKVWFSNSDATIAFLATPQINEKRADTHHWQSEKQVENTEPGASQY